MPNLKIHTLPTAGHNGDLYVPALQTDAPEDKNDIGLLFAFEGNVTGFALENIGVTAVDDSNSDISDEVSFVETALTGREGGAVYAVTLRPPTGGGDGTITIERVRKHGR